ncbi:multiple epidermal growth factor-like domains protein 11 [Neocloeon triangulifer]|uniref:multiple epidermal growth factor-like domains protein 11 n=1 Tax=Neocloeon triangulifer TaxID=2078957 RepID=UPI00286F3359|nr:multiple epidermal growth factor-like domains protein 11 [Neocloeon triangulifer]
MKGATIFVTIIWLTKFAFNSFGSAATLGEACNFANSCEPDSSVICEENICKCRQRFHEESGQCLAALGKACSIVGDECAAIPYALCDADDGLCKCIRGYEPLHGDFPSASPADKIHCAATKIGDHCLEPQQCRRPYSQFDGDRCGCKPGYVPDNKDDGCLLNVSHLGDNCRNGAQCRTLDPNTTCKGPKEPKTCTCKKDYFVGDAFNKKCLSAARKYGEACQSLSECTLRLGVDAKCSKTEQVCVCIDGLVPSIDKSICLPRRELNDFCVQDQQCSENAPNSECAANFKCSCVEGFEEIQATCFKIPQQIGDSCADSSQCISHVTSENIVCRDGFCQCTPGHTPNAEFKECLPGVFGIGSPCVENAQCSENVEHTICDTFERRCVCKRDFVPSADNSRCLPRTGGLFDQCVDAGQCAAEIGGEVDCINGICNCKANCHYLDGTCWQSKLLQDACTDSRECRLAEYSQRAECDASGFCACRANLTANLFANTCNSGAHIVASFAIPALLLAFLQLLT